MITSGGRVHTAKRTLPSACSARQVVLEGERVNVAVTGPGATIALALQFLRTNDVAVAASFQLPQNAHSLDLVRLALKVMPLVWQAFAEKHEAIALQGHAHPGPLGLNPKLALLQCSRSACCTADRCNDTYETWLARASHCGLCSQPSILSPKP